MNSKTLANDYFENLWNYCKKNSYTIFNEINSYYPKILISTNSSDAETSRLKAIKNYNDVFAYDYIETQEKFKKIIMTPSFSKDLANKVAFISTTNVTDNESIKKYNRFNVFMLENLIDAASEKDYSIICKNIDNLISYPTTNMDKYWSILNKVKSKYGIEKAKLIFENIPKKVGRIESMYSTDNLKENITKIEKFFENESHTYMLSYVSKRAPQANMSQAGSIKLRDVLIEYYKNNNEQLKDYIEYSPALKKYLNTDDNGSIILDKNSLLHYTIDIEQMKAVVALKGFENKQYIELLESFIQVYKKNDSRVENISSGTIKLNKNETYVTVYIKIKQNETFPENEFSRKVNAFTRQINQLDDNTRKDNRELVKFINTWWKAEELNHKLNSDLNTSLKEKNKKTKI